MAERKKIDSNIEKLVLGLLSIDSRDTRKEFEGLSKLSSGKVKRSSQEKQLRLPTKMSESIYRDLGIIDVNEISIHYFNAFKTILEKFAELEKMTGEEQKRKIREILSSLELPPQVFEDVCRLFPRFREIAVRDLYDLNPASISGLLLSEGRNGQVVESRAGSEKAPVVGRQKIYQNIVGASPELISIFECIEKIACSNLSVLIIGESGTGKELVARAIHNASKRKNEKFVAINCGAIPESIMESELFGHVAGAFTGAIRDKKGYFEFAHGGTIFLDEISEMSLAMQVKLLRAIQERAVTPVGSNNLIPVDVRLISATNQDLEACVAQSTFRRDLFYRINEMCIRIPPLRDRPSDIPLLARHFLEKFNRENGKNVRGIEKSALEALSSYSWPGNVRELENVLKRAVVFADDFIRLEHLPEVFQRHRPAGSTLAEQLAQAERQIILRALEENNWNITRTAKKLDVSRRTVERKMREYGIPSRSGGAGGKIKTK